MQRDDPGAIELSVRVPFAIRKRGGRKLVITPDGRTERPRPRVDSALVKAIARAHRSQRLLESGECASIAELAAAEKIDRSYLSRVLRLTLLAPEIVEAIVEGRQPEGVTLPGLMQGFPVECASSETPFWRAPSTAQGQGGMVFRKARFGSYAVLSAARQNGSGLLRDL